MSAANLRNPEASASFLSHLTMAYLTPLLVLGSRKTLQAEDLGPVLPCDSAAALAQRFARHWAAEVAAAAAAAPRAKPSILRAVRRTLGSAWLLAVAAFFLSTGLAFLPPLILQELVAHLQGTAPLAPARLWVDVAAMLVVPVLAILLQTYHNNVMARVGTNIRTMLTAAIFAKALVLRPSPQWTAGEVLTRVSVDAALPLRFVAFASQVLVAPPTIAVALYLVWRYVGVSMLAGLAFIALGVPASGALVSQLFGLRRAALRLADSRIRLTVEALHGIRVVKMNGWEGPVAAQITAVRDGELALLQRAAYAMQINLSLLLLSLPVLMPALIFATYSSLGNQLDISTVFATLALLSILRAPIGFLPMGLTLWLQFNISLARIADLLLAPELAGVPAIADAAEAEATPIVLTSVCAHWDSAAPQEAAAAAAAAAGRGGGGRAARGGALPPPPEPPEPPARPLCLRDVTLRVRAGELLAVVGPVASGKSSLLAAMLGEVAVVSGSVARRGGSGARLALAAQQPWIINDTLRANVLFGAPHDPQRLAAVLDACALRPDLALLPLGELTEVGERGVTLSGGQKARVALARAAYAAPGAAAVLLDDPLAAVDAHVGEHIFTRAIVGLMRGATRVLATNALHVLPHCDRVAVLGEGGVLRALGTLAEIRAAAPGLLESLAEDRGAAGAAGVPVGLQPAAATGAAAAVAVAVAAPVPSAAAPPSAPAPAPVPAPAPTAAEAVDGVGKGVAVPAATAAAAAADAPSTVMTVEERATGNVELAVILSYIRANGPVLAGLVLLSSSAARAAELGGLFWLSSWASASASALQSRAPFDASWWLHVYVALNMASVLLSTLRGACLAQGRINASRGLHAAMLARVLAAPTHFFDSTPMGRLVNRFSRETAVLDTELPMTLGQLLQNSFAVLGTLATIAVSTSGLLVLPLAPILAVYYWLQAFYLRTSTELQRLESIARSPLFSRFTLVLTGTSTVRAFALQAAYAADTAGSLDGNTVPYLLAQLASNWLGLWLNVLSAVVGFLVAVVAVAATSLVSPAWAAVALASSLELAAGLTQMVRMSAQFEANMTSVQRVAHYAEGVPQEGGSGSGSAAAAAAAAAAALPKDWPARGELVVQGLRLRYGRLSTAAEAAAAAAAAGAKALALRAPAAPAAPGAEDLELGCAGPSAPNSNTFALGPEVLHGVSFTVPAGAKLGIVGRTGSGKSSLAVALFRLVEPCGGRICLDGVDLAGVPLAHLRSRLSIIPQEPWLLSTTLRRNVDPLGEHSEEALREALGRVRLGSHALDMEIAEGGSNLSVGERQLVCIARALLRKSSLVVFDEASASVDGATDAFLQAAIRTLFASATVLTIAHRLHTVADADAILVLDSGRVAECGPPKELLGREGGVFRGMVARLGPEAAAEVERLAGGACAKRRQ